MAVISVAPALRRMAAPAAFLLVAPFAGQTWAAGEQAPATLQDCAGCHMAYPPQFLPRRSWSALMSGLENHFGENANLPARANAEILGYLLAHAADAPANAESQRYMWDIDEGSVPLRITDTPWWRGAHEEVDLSQVSVTPVKSVANCLGCHRTIATGGQE